MRARQLRAPVGEPVEVGEHEPDRAPRHEHRRRVDDVLARRAEMHGVGRRADPLAQRLHERLRRVPHGAAVLRDQLRVEEIAAARLGDARCRLLRHEPGRGPREREGALRVEHALEPGAVGTASRSCAGTKIASNGVTASRAPGACRARIAATVRGRSFQTEEAGRVLLEDQWSHLVAEVGLLEVAQPAVGRDRRVSRTRTRSRSCVLA